MTKITTLFIAALPALCTLWGCHGGSNKAAETETQAEADTMRTALVSVMAQAWALEQIAGPGWRVEVLLPNGADPEEWDPRPSDMQTLETADVWFSLGALPFEERMAGRNAHTVDVADSIAPLADGEHGHGDPHLWPSPANMRIMARQMARWLAQADTAGAQGYTQRLAAVEAAIDSIDNVARRRLAEAGVEAFLVWHPSLGHAARDWGLRQVALGPVGHKELSAKRVAQNAREAAASGARVMVVQPGAEQQMARWAPEGVEVHTVNLMGRDWPSMIDSLSAALAASRP